MAKKKSKRAKREQKSRETEAKKLAKLARKAARKAAKKARKPAKRKAAKKAAKKAVRRKTARKTAKKAAKKAGRRKTAKKTARKAARPRRPAKPAPKTAKPAAPAPQPKPAPAAKPTPAPGPVAPAKAGEPGRGIDAREDQRKPTPQPKPEPKPRQEVTFLTGHFDATIERYYSMVAKNTRESHRLGTLQIDRILAGNPRDIVALAEKSHDVINNWRNDFLSEETIRECQVEFSTGDPFTCALKWAQRSIDAAAAQGISSPYGYWARAYAYKYQRQPNRSAADYKTALSFPPRAFISNVGRRRKDLLVEWLEGLVYWARQDQVQKLIDKLESDAPVGAGKLEAWINWVKCFALHLAGRFDASNALYPDYLPDDVDVNLIIAANHARLGHEDLRQLHRRLFREKDGNDGWSAAKEIERSPFADKDMRNFWYQSVDKALHDPEAGS
jgi:hypothetical protein